MEATRQNESLPIWWMWWRGVGGGRVTTTTARVGSRVVSNCCDPAPYRRFFNRKEAERHARGYRRKGLDPMASSMVQYLVSRGVEAADVLDVGGGVGAIQLELLKAGAAKSVNVELSSGYEEAAQRLAEEEGFEDRITRQLGDFVEHQHEFEPADIVVMNRVVCCYPWMERMMEAAVGKATQYLALTFPREKWWMEFGMWSVNAYMGLRKCDFRAFVHPVADIESVATSAGFVVCHTDNNFAWQAVVFERAA
ncbi:MAG: class I SAM-dependent methyltransferase [Acidimicrobiia bacterium]